MQVIQHSLSVLLSFELLVSELQRTQPDHDVESFLQNLSGPIGENLRNDRLMFMLAASGTGLILRLVGVGDVDGRYGNTVPIIKQIRKITGFGLREARDLVVAARDKPQKVIVDPDIDFCELLVCLRNLHTAGAVLEC